MHCARAILAVLLIGLLVPAAAAAPPAPSSQRPRTFALEEHARTYDSETALVEIDPSTGHRIGRQLLLGDWVQDDPVLSADRHTVAFGSSGTGRIMRVDLQHWRVLKPFKVAPRFLDVDVLSWTPERLIALTANNASKYPKPVTVRVLDPRSARVTASTPLGGLDLGHVVAPDGGAVVLTAPHEHLGTATLHVVDAAGAVRSVTLDGIAAGWSIEELRYPGLAVDFAGGRAFAMTRDTVAEVDLATLAVTYHAIAVEPRAPLGKPQHFDNANSFDGWARTARWAGGRIAVSGQDYARAGEQDQLVRPAGLRLLDPQTWSVQVLEADASYFALIDDTLLTATADTDLAAFTADGRPLYRRRAKTAWRIDHGELYITTHNGQVRSLRDARTGAEVRRIRVDLNFDSTFTLP